MAFPFQLEIICVRWHLTNSCETVIDICITKAAREREAAQRKQDEDNRRMQLQELEWTAKRHAAEEKARKQEEDRILEDLKQRVRRSKYRCTCKKPHHTDQCALCDVSGRLQWPGQDHGLSFEESERALADLHKRRFSV